MTVDIPPHDFTVDVRKLCFAYVGNSSEGVAGEQTLVDVDLQLPKGSRCLLVGANGCELSSRPSTFHVADWNPTLAGKSTLLRILAGKKLTPTRDAARIMGKDVFNFPSGGVVYLGTEWANNPVVRGDIGVDEFLDSVGGYRHKERRDILLDLLDVDLSW